MTNDSTLLPDGDGGRQADENPPAPQLQFTDGLVRTLFLWAIPSWIRPNHVTLLRFLLIPVVVVLLYLDHRWWGLGVFLFAACTDFIDGAMARTRDQITLLGTYTDPIADKLLVAATLAWIGIVEDHYLVVEILVAFIIIELVIAAIGVRMLVRTRTRRSSNWFGKIKMVFQTVAVLLFLVAGMLDLPTWTTVSLYLLWVALALGIISGGLHIRGMAQLRSKTP